MPELPEVEVARRALEEHCVGKRIVRCSAADDTKVIDGVAPPRLEAALVGRTISAARRKGKNLWLALDSPPFPSFQFGFLLYRMPIRNGWSYLHQGCGTEQIQKMDDGLEFSFTDKRRFAKIRFLDNPEAVPPISELGPDALFEPLHLDDFVESLSRKKAPIKALLLDQSFISGIGNWIADEVLYQARIHPMQTASMISKEKCKALHQCIIEVIEKSLEVGCNSSQYPENWIFHSREKKPGKAFVEGKKIDFITVGGRTSAYVPELQKLDGIDATASRAKISKEQSKSNKAAREVDDDEEEAKPAKRGRKQLVKATHEIQEDEEDTKESKRGRKQPAKTSKGSWKKAHHSSEGSGDDDSDDEAVDKVVAEQGKRRDPKQPAEAKSSSDKGGSAAPAKRPQRKKRQL
uniref:DNA-(apurinic or apyrimidinic site) lyase n=1 Tax=Oryza sativa subsp. japonica TaxID=39947 RepID=Q6UU93_ORYSJ|nr:putative glycosylase [Oryza sativa Japonica Group]AAQ56476.1 putative glycosylase [Oryza sativa Japonica Group]